MSDVRLPEWIEDRLREEHPRMKDIALIDDRALYRCAFRDGAEACYLALLERAPSFDEAAWPQTKKSEELAAEGARDQFAQDAAQIAALKAQNERLREVMAHAALQCEIPDSRYAAHAAMKTLRESLKEEGE